MKLRIVTYNIHKGVSTLGSRPRIHAIKQALSGLSADLVFLQEVQGRHDLLALRHSTSWPRQSQHEFLADEHQHSAYGMNAIYDHGHHGNALLSNFPIVSFRNHDVSDHAFESRGILHCMLHLGKTNVHCYVIHLGLFAGSRLRQTQALIDAVMSTAPPDAPLLIAGDFNDWTDALSANLRKRLDVVEVFDQGLTARSFGAYLRRLSGRGPRKTPARTFPAAMPVLQLDRIYVRGFRVETAKVLHGASWARLSDHAPIVADLYLLDQAAEDERSPPEEVENSYASSKL
ncbi:MAG: endonuclease/exonuclease/phosphatase family protein [Oxalobacteraceae bacterium]|jgi:endonuclease/exonuclease/phosphatase family metal-dependent hydrolase|nr:endonuclease/exonuclease/phosphatase family protein [Oxalobacteraceae bacterium]